MPIFDAAVLSSGVNSDTVMFSNRTHEFGKQDLFESHERNPGDRTPTQAYPLWPLCKDFVVALVFQWKNSSPLFRRWKYDDIFLALVTNEHCLLKCHKIKKRTLGELH